MVRTKKQTKRRVVNHPLLFKRLRRELRKLEYNDAAETLADWINRSPSYTSRCLAGRISFTPKEIRTILAELGWEEADAEILFPVLGLDKEAEAV